MATLCWSVDVKGGEAVRSRVLDGRRGVVTGVSLVGPLSGRSVVVEAYVKTASGNLALASLSSERPRVELLRAVLVMESDSFCCRVRRHGDGAIPPDEDEEDGDDDNSESEDEYSVASEDDDDDSSSEEEESDGEVDGEAASADVGVTLSMLQTLHRRKFVPEGQFVGGSARRFACAGSTLGFMRVAAVESEGGDDRKQILVFYRYTRFRASPDGVKRRGRTTEHQLRFIATGDHAARSLAWAGSSMGLLIYPGCLTKKLEEITKQLQELWSSLASQVSVPPGARRVEVFVDVGILRRADYDGEHGAHVRRAGSMVADPWPGASSAWVARRCRYGAARKASTPIAPETQTSGRQSGGGWTTPGRIAPSAWSCWRATTSPRGPG
ncbi:hypothetical protein ZWY2020_001443 [Hordeum vulgare]|nr:hypothetical protein ZWY2020_001443 [Hordeum vulgare]